ncbi:Lrp/AsnC ligand binding domain-containing protein [Sulfurisphaera javensis]|uniref:Lrp/AsnC ligand binding domain-containing protein n=1 Tax=Sulfurisphaera javensis TaxID=2049879 RepID=A0AAT9GS14_9CREN
MPVKAYILVVTAVGKETDVANSIRKINGVKEANSVYGEYDVVAEILAESLDELNKIISQIRRDPSILRTVTLIVM